MSATILPAIQREIIRYSAMVYLGFGLTGNIFCCIMFTRASYRHAVSTVYLLSFATYSIVYLLWSFFPLLYSLYNPDLQTVSVSYCKVRQYFGHVISLQMRYAIVFASVDRFLITRPNVRIRALSSVRTARILVCLTLVVSVLIAVHMPIMMEIRNGACVMPGVYRLIYAIYQNIILSLAPPVLMTVFSLLTIHSLRRRQDIVQTRSKQRDRHLARMVVGEVVINVLSSIPFSANLLYGAATYYATNKSPERLEIESFCTFISQLCLFSLGVTPFYLFILVSKAFRHEFANLLGHVGHKLLRQQARIVPFSVTGAVTKLGKQ